MSGTKDPSFDAVEVGEAYGPLTLIADAAFVRKARFSLGVDGAQGRDDVVPAEAIARELQQLFLTTYDSNRIVGLHQAEEISFHADAKVGAEIVMTGRCVDKYEKRGKGYFVIECDARDREGRLLVRQIQTEIMSIEEGTVVGGGSAPPEGPRVLGEWPADRAPVTKRGETVEAGTPIGPDIRLCDADEMAVYSGIGLFRHNVHTDDRIAIAAGFPTTVAQGMTQTLWLSQMLARILGREFYGGGWIKTKFLKPIFAGDTVRVFAVASGRSGNVLDFDVWARNQHEDLTAAGWARAEIGLVPAANQEEH